MLTYEGFYYANAGVSVVLGGVLNGALFWLIVHRTEEEGRPYRPILLLTTAIELANVAVFGVVMPVLSVKGCAIIVFSMGPLGWIPRHYNLALISVWQFFIMFRLYSVCVPFIYRYAVLCRKRIHYGPKQYIALLSMGIGAALATVAEWCWSGYTWTEERQEQARLMFFGEVHNTTIDTVNNSIPTYPHYIIPHFAEGGRALFQVSFCMVFVYASYGLTFVCAWRIRRYLREEMNNLSQKRACMLNKQITTALLLQACVPLVLELLPTSRMTFEMVSNIQLANVSFYEAAVYAWTPVANPLVSMWVVRSYRRQMASWLKCRWSNSVTSISGQGALATPNPAVGMRSTPL